MNKNKDQSEEWKKRKRKKDKDKTKKKGTLEDIVYSRWLITLLDPEETHFSCF